MLKLIGKSMWFIMYLADTTATIYCMYSILFNVKLLRICIQFNLKLIAHQIRRKPTQ